MAIIAISGVPEKWSLQSIAIVLARATKAKLLQAIKFEPNHNQTKTAYVHVSEKLDPIRIVEKLNEMPQRKNMKAYIPDQAPNLPMPKKKEKYCPEDNPKNVLPLTHREILYEMQSKFCGLYNLSKKTGHKLLRDISIILFKRLKEIISVNEEAASNCMALSKAYRKKHPHFGDFQFILSTLHALQDMNGAPRAQISEEQLALVQHHPFMYEDVPYNKIQLACKQYADVISKAVNNHIKNLNTAEKESDSEEEVASKKVRMELKKMAPFMNSIVQQVAVKNFIPIKPAFHRIKMYGEPFIPPPQVMSPFLKKFKVMRWRRSTWIYNMLKFNIPPQNYSGLMAMDGTVVSGAKLVIRSGNAPRYKVPLALLEEQLGDVAAARDFQRTTENEEDDMVELMEE